LTRLPRFLRRLITHNMGWKLACLGIAVLLWYMLIVLRNQGQ
jgi:hypothetical protein